MESHPLALRFLGNLLQDEGFDAVTFDENIASQPDFVDYPPVFLVDGDSFQRHVERYLQSFRARFPQAKVLVIGRKLSTDELCRLLFLGIHGFVCYDDITANLRHALESLMEGHMWIPSDVLERFAQYAAELSRLKRQGRKVFTAREQLILGLLERRLSDKEISAALAIKERTVRFHLQNVFGKLGVHDRHSVVNLVKSGRLLEFPMT